MPTENARISYYDWTNHDLKYAAWDGSQWQIQTVDSAEDVGTHSSLALDAAGKPHISYSDSTNGGLKYAELVAEDWQIQTVDVDKGSSLGVYLLVSLGCLGRPSMAAIWRWHSR